MKINGMQNNQIHRYSYKDICKREGIYKTELAAANYFITIANDDGIYATLIFNSSENYLEPIIQDWDGDTFIELHDATLNISVTP